MDEKKRQEKEKKEQQDFQKLIGLIFDDDLKNFRKEIFSLPILEIFKLCRRFRNHQMPKVNSVCNDRFWASILLDETDKDISQIHQFLAAPPKQPAQPFEREGRSKTRDILNYYNENRVSFDIFFAQIIILIEKRQFEELFEISKENISKKRQEAWKEVFHHGFESNIMEDSKFEIKYRLGKSVINNKIEHFAIIFDNISKEASIWNCDSNDFYCDHKHDLKELKNWIEFKKEKNDDICPNCCN